MRNYVMTFNRDSRYYVDAIVTAAAIDEEYICLTFERIPERWFNLQVKLGKCYFGGSPENATDWREPIKATLETPNGFFYFESENGIDPELLDFVVNNTMYLYNG
jgi:hypothetical protein